jgi:hypothetical protein
MLHYAAYPMPSLLSHCESNLGTSYAVQHDACHSHMTRTRVMESGVTHPAYTPMQA